MGFDPMVILMGGFLEDVVVVVLVAAEVGVTESGVVSKGVVEEPWAWEEVRLVFPPTVRPSLRKKGTQVIGKS